MLILLHPARIQRIRSNVIYLFINEPGVVRSGALTLLIVLAQQLDYIKTNIKPITSNHYYGKVYIIKCHFILQYLNIGKYFKLH